jgi:cytochrome c peroxidase
MSGRLGWLQRLCRIGLACGAVLAILALLVGSPPAPAAGGDGALGLLPVTPLQPAPALDPQKVALGRALFVDRRLSSSGQLACSTCHQLNRAGIDGEKQSTGAQGGQNEFNTPTIFNAALNYHFNWRGNFQDLEALTDSALLSPQSMNATWPAILDSLDRSQDYADGFSRAYGHAPNRAAVLDALVLFQRTLVTPDSRFDFYLRGDVTALTEQEEKGYILFRDYGCVACHQGQNIGGNLFQKFGVFPDNVKPTHEKQPSDLGRYLLTGREEDRRVFRVPSLRNVAETAPYFHDGREPDLRNAVRLMAQRQLGEQLSEAEIAQIVAFLGTLTGRYEGVAVRGGEAPGP